MSNKIDFSKYELVVTEKENYQIYELLIKKDNKYSYMSSIGFSYLKTTLETILTVFGDYGKYIFGQPLDIKDSSIEMPYFLEKLRYNTCQDIKGEFDSDYLIEQINSVAQDMENNFDEFDPFHIEIINDLKAIDNEFELNAYLYNMNSGDRDDLFGKTLFPTGKPLKNEIEVIYQAFKEIGRRLMQEKLNGN